MIVILFRNGQGGFASEALNIILVFKFIVKQISHRNATSDAPSNVIFSFEEALKMLYGKTFSGFVNYLVPDSTFYFSL